MEHLLKIFCAQVGKCAPLVGKVCFSTIILAVYALFPLDLFHVEQYQKLINIAF